MNRDDEDVQERMMGRFTGDDSDEKEESSMSSKSEVSDDIEESSNPYVSAENVKKEYPARQFYLHQETVDRLDEEYKRLQYVADVDFGKDRHYYPAVVAAGLERIEEMEGDEFEEILERLEGGDRE